MWLLGCTGTGGVLGGRTEVAEVSDAGVGVVPNLLKCRVPVLRGMLVRVYRYRRCFWWAYRTCRSVGYRCWGRTELTEVSGTGIEVVPNFTEVLGTGVETVPNLPMCLAPVLRPY